MLQTVILTGHRISSKKCKGNCLLWWLQPVQLRFCLLDLPSAGLSLKLKHPLTQLPNLIGAQTGTTAVLQVRAMARHNSTELRDRFSGRRLPWMYPATVPPHTRVKSRGPSKTRLPGALQWCRQWLTWSRSTRDHQYTCFLRNEESAKQEANAAELQGSSWTQPFSVVPSGHRNVLVRQQPKPKGKHAVSWPTGEHHRRPPQKTPCHSHRQQRIHRAAATTFLAPWLLGTVVGSTALHTAVKTSVTPEWELGPCTESSFAALCSSGFLTWRLIRAAKGH